MPRVLKQYVGIYQAVEDWRPIGIRMEEGYSSIDQRIFFNDPPWRSRFTAMAFLRRRDNGIPRDHDDRREGSLEAVAVRPIPESDGEVGRPGLPIPGTRTGFESDAKIDDFESLRHIRVVRRRPLDQDQVIPRNALRRHPPFRP